MYSFFRLFFWLKFRTIIPKYNKKNKNRSRSTRLDDNIGKSRPSGLQYPQKMGGQGAVHPRPPWPIYGRNAPEKWVAGGAVYHRSLDLFFGYFSWYFGIISGILVKKKAEKSYITIGIRLSINYFFPLSNINSHLDLFFAILRCISELLSWILVKKRA